MGQLEYDNSAFYYFMISMLSLYLIPGWYYTSKYVAGAFLGGGQASRSVLEKKKEEKMKVNQQGIDKLKNRAFQANASALVAFSLLFVYLIFQVNGDSAIASFDPYQILSIDRSATDKQIKKAYKLKALEFHPDKNIGNERAAQMFMMVAKAYEALTDDEAKANWEKFGNPDGKQSFEMSIGLPTFLMEKGNHNLILIAYLLLMVVVIPSVVWAYYRQSQMYGEGNIMYRTYQTYANLLLRPDRPAVAKLKTLPELFVTAAEFEGDLSATAADQQALQAFHTLFANMGSFKAKGSAKKAGGPSDGGEFMCKPSKWLEVARQNSPPNFWRVTKGNLILHHHLGRVQLLDEATRSGTRLLELPAGWAKALDAMLLQSPALLAAILAIVSDGKKLESMLEIMRLSQCLTQGLWPGRGQLKDSHAPFYQLPHVGPDAVSAMAGKSGKLTLKDFVRHRFTVYCEETRKGEPHLSDGELRGMWDKMGARDLALLEADPAYGRKGCAELSDEHRADVESVVQCLPDVDVSVRHFVHDEDFTCERDTVTLEVKLTRHHVKSTDTAKGHKAPPVHAPYFPSSKKEEEWWVVLKAEDVRMSPWEFIMEKMVDQSKEVTTEIKFPAPPRKGKYQFTVHVVSDSYLGLDVEHAFELQVESAAELPEVEDAYKDEDLEMETTLEATFGAGNVDSDVSDSEDEDGGGKKGAAKKAAKKDAKKDAKKGSSEDNGAVIVEAADADSDSSSGEELD